MNCLSKTAFAIMALALVAAPLRAQDGRVCSDQTLNGRYGFTLSGIRPTAPGGPTVQIAGVALTTFDGNGNLTQFDNVNTTAGALPANRPATGTYHVEADCSGTMTINPEAAPGQPTPPPVHLHIVVVDNGKEVRTAVVDPGFVITSNGRRVN